jgi:hypothetical protein
LASKKEIALEVVVGLAGNFDELADMTPRMLAPHSQRVKVKTRHID